MGKTPRKHGTNPPPKRGKRSGVHRNRPKQSLATDLLDFYDDLTATHASIAFVLHAVASATETGASTTRRLNTGAAFCIEWLEDRMGELERRLSTIRDRLRFDPGKTRRRRTPGTGSSASS